MLEALLSRWGSMDDSGVDRAAGPRNSREEHVIVRDFDQHEALILIEVGCGLLVWPKVALPQLACGARHEVVDTLLRLDSLVDVIVAGKHDVDAVSKEDRLEHDTKINRGAVPRGVRIQRMMEVTDLPRLFRVAESRLQPLQLFGIQLRAVENNEPHVVAGVAVVTRRPCCTACTTRFPADRGFQGSP